MPIYEYTCTACNHTFELIQKVTDAPSTHCDACKKDTAIRLVSAPGFQLKGTGWYVTDFKNKPTSPASEKSTAEAATAEKKTQAPATPTTTGETN
jgi:putative FmdB family regulatory protein